MKVNYKPINDDKKILYIINVLLKNDFNIKVNKNDYLVLNYKQSLVFFNTEKFYLKSGNYYNDYLFYDLGETLSDKELKNFIFYCKLSSVDKQYLKNKIENKFIQPKYDINSILKIDDTLNEIKENSNIGTLAEKNAIDKRIKKLKEFNLKN